jgi:hypothetical protein
MSSPSTDSKKTQKEETSVVPEKKEPSTSTDSKLSDTPIPIENSKKRKHVHFNQKKDKHHDASPSSSSKSDSASESESESESESDSGSSSESDSNESDSKKQSEKSDSDSNSDISDDDNNTSRKKRKTKTPKKKTRKRVKLNSRDNSQDEVDGIAPPPIYAQGDLAIDNFLNLEQIKIPNPPDVVELDEDSSKAIESWLIYIYEYIEYRLPLANIKENNIKKIIYKTEDGKTSNDLLFWNALFKRFKQSSPSAVESFAPLNLAKLEKEANDYSSMLNIKKKKNTKTLSKPICPKLDREMAGMLNMWLTFVYESLVYHYDWEIRRKPKPNNSSRASSVSSRMRSTDDLFWDVLRDQFTKTTGMQPVF